MSVRRDQIDKLSTGIGVTVGRVSHRQRKGHMSSILVEA